MSLRINTNVDALTAYNNLNKTQQSGSTSNERLSSGLRINRAADDAAGLAISQGLTSQINGIGQAVRNAQDGINVVQTADGALSETHSILQRMRTLAVQSANDSNDNASRNDIQTEVNALSTELDKIANNTTFNNIKLLDGNFTSKKFQVGYAANDTLDVNITQGSTVGAVSTAGGAITTAGTLVLKEGGTTTTTGTIAVTSSASETANALNKDTAFSSKYLASFTTDASTGAETLVVKAKDGGAFSVDATSTAVGVSKTASAATGVAGGFSSAALGVDSTKVDLSTQAGAESAITALDSAIQNVSTARATLGATQNQFQHHINNLTVTQQNLQASNSSIQDTDMAQEMSNFTRTQVLQNAGISMLAQANQSSQGILKLLG